MRFETEVAIRAVGLAQALADARRGADRTSSKGGIDLVTDTDLACEETIRAELERSCPEIPVVGEERGGSPQPGKPYWLVDPICGTRPFASNVPLYCTNIALVEDGSVSVAAIGVGRTREVLFAEVGLGARLRLEGEDRIIAVDDQSNTLFIDGRTEEAADSVRRAMLLNRWYVWQFSSTLAYAYLACGRIAAVLQFPSLDPVPSTGSVHSAAGCFIAREAGAIVTDLSDGMPWRLGTQSFMMASTQALDRELRRSVLCRWERRPEDGG